jgi:hypothetical protein
LTLILLAGCTEVPRKAAPVHRARAPETGYVNIEQVEAEDPRMPILIEIDRAVKTSQSKAAINDMLPKDLGIQVSMSDVSALGTVDVHQGLEAQQTKRLKVITAHVVAGLDKRLRGAEELSLEALSVEELAAGRAELASDAAALQEQASQQTKLYNEDAAQIASLKMQIAAMQVDSIPPLSAPKGYWTSIQEQKQIALNKLLGKYDLDIKAIFDNRDSSIAAEQAAIARKVDSEMTDDRRKAEQSRGAALTRAEQRFDKDEQDLELEDSRVLNEARTMLKSQSDASLVPILLDQKQVMSQAGNLNTAALLEYRTVLNKKILSDTEESIGSISARLHVKLVGKRKGVADLTPLFAQAIKDQTWTVS